MSAFTPPRADLRGGSQSEDSLAILRSIFFTLSTTLCLFAGSHRAVKGFSASEVLIHSHRLGSELPPEALESVGGRFPDIFLLHRVFVDINVEIHVQYSFYISHLVYTCLHLFVYPIVTVYSLIISLSHTPQFFVLNFHLRSKPPLLFPFLVTQLMSCVVLSHAMFV